MRFVSKDLGQSIKLIIDGLIKREFQNQFNRTGRRKFPFDAIFLPILIGWSFKCL